MRTSALLTLSFGLLAAPTSAHASWASWTNQCSTGSFQVCASVTIGLAYSTATNTTNVVVRLANLQGSTSYLPDPGAYGIQTYGVRGLSAPAGSGAGPAPDSWWEYSSGVGSVLIAPMWISGGPETSVWGCDAPTGLPGQTSVIQTCGGWFGWSLVLPGKWDLTDATYASIGEAYTDYAWPQQPSTVPGCTTATLGGDAGSCQMVVPEPFTIALLGSGLAALGGVGTIRRRRKNL